MPRRCDVTVVARNAKYTGAVQTVFKSPWDWRPKGFFGSGSQFLGFVRRTSATEVCWMRENETGIS